MFSKVIPPRSGTSNRVTTAYSLIQCACTHIREEAITNYKNKYEIGDDRDNPDRPFPQDGRWRWATPKKHLSKIIYFEGIEDAKWMAEKEQNHLNRNVSAPKLK